MTQKTHPVASHSQQTHPEKKTLVTADCIDLMGSAAKWEVAQKVGKEDKASQMEPRSQMVIGHLLLLTNEEILDS